MSIEAHVAELERRHRALEMEIAEAHARRPPDRFVETTQAACEGRTRTTQTLINQRAECRDRGMRVVSMIHGLHGHQIADHPRRRWWPSRRRSPAWTGQPCPGFRLGPRRAGFVSMLKAGAAARLLG